MRSVVQHLRLHFSLFLLPVYLFAYSQAVNIDFTKALWAFFILHFLIYPASNAFNSYFDKDEGPIGGIAKPLPVNKKLYFTAQIMDLIAVILAYWFCSPFFAICCLIYILVSKAYSHPIIRLKKRPIISWLVVGFFQGAWIYWSVFQLITNANSFSMDQNIVLPALLSSLNLWAFYPITQIYQHDEDAMRGDITLSLLLGIRGTFMFTGILFGIAAIGFYFLLKPSQQFLYYLVFLGPGVLFFNFWAIKVWSDSKNANFKNTMIMNTLGAFGLNLFFAWLIIIS